MSTWIIRIILGIVTIVLLVLIGIYSGQTEENPSVIGVLLVLYLAVGLIVGGFFITVILPAMGDRIGNYFYSDESEVEEDPRAKAIAAMNRGEYDEAIEEYRELMKMEPEDRGHVVEVARIYQEKLHNLNATISTFEQALASREWSEDDEAFFLFRLSDLYVQNNEDFGRARSYLNAVLEKFPETRHSANATHKLHELEQAEYVAAHRHH